MGSTFLVTMWTVYHEAHSVEVYRRQALFLESEVVATTNLHTAIRNQIAETMRFFFREGNSDTRLTQIKDSVRSHLKTLEELDRDTKQREDSSISIRRNYEYLDQELERGITLYRNGKAKEGKNHIESTVSGIFHDVLVPILQLRLKEQQTAYHEMGKKLEKSISLMKASVILIFGLATLLVSVLIHHLSQSFGSRLLSVLEATKKVKQGDLKNQIDASGEDELSELATAFNQMVVALSDAQKKMIEQQEQIAQHSKMSALGQMAGGIAHEINNPLAVIVADASKVQLLSERKRLSPEELAASVERILSTTERIAKIIKGLRTFARDGEKDPYQTTAARDIVSDTLEFCYARFKSHGVELRVGDIPETVQFECRPVQVAQVLLNLLNNAFDAISKAPSPWVLIEVLDSAESVQFIVTDCGTGIPKEIADRILEPFFSTKGVGQGTGMGLSISSGIVKNHQGELFLDRESRHTRFVARFPKKHLGANQKAA